MQKKWTDVELVETLYTKNEFALLAVSETYYEDLSNHFEKKYKTLNREDIYSIIADSLINIADHPEKYKREKGTTLKTYLIRDINSDIINFINKRKLSIVELIDEVGNNKNDITLEVKEQETQIKIFFKTTLRSDLDCQIAWMMEIDGFSKTEEYIEILQLQDLSYSDQQNEVKKNKDRISVKLKRKGWKNFLKTLQ